MRAKEPKPGFSFYIPSIKTTWIDSYVNVNSTPFQNCSETKVAGQGVKVLLDYVELGVSMCPRWLMTFGLRYVCLIVE